MKDVDKASVNSETRTLACAVVRDAHIEVSKISLHHLSFRMPIISMSMDIPGKIKLTI